MSKNENARQINNIHEVNTASIKVLSFEEDKNTGREQRTKNSPSLFIDADEEQTLWENYIRHGTPHGSATPVIIAREISDPVIDVSFVEVNA